MKELETEVRATVRAMLADVGPAAVVPALLDSGFDALLAEEGGVAAGWFFEEQGQALATSGALDLVVGRTLGVDAREFVIGYPVPGAGPPISGSSVGAVAVSALVLPGAYRTDQVAVVGHDGDHGRIVTVRADRSSIEPLPVGERRGGWQRLSGTFDIVSVNLLDRPEEWLSAARLALAHELLGVARFLLEHTIAHTSERVQFGRPITAHQTVRHRLADGEVTIRSLEALLRATVEADPNSADERLLAATAKALAGRTALCLADHAQQLCGGLGFTRESRLHRAIDRVYLLDSFLGSYASLRSHLGRQLGVLGTVPRLFGLAPPVRAS